MVSSPSGSIFTCLEVISGRLLEYVCNTGRIFSIRTANSNGPVSKLQLHVIIPTHSSNVACVGRMAGAVARDGTQMLPQGDELRGGSIVNATCFFPRQGMLIVMCSIYSLYTIYAAAKTKENSAILLDAELDPPVSIASNTRPTQFIAFTLYSPSQIRRLNCCFPFWSNSFGRNRRIRRKRWCLVIHTASIDA